MKRNNFLGNQVQSQYRCIFTLIILEQCMNIIFDLQHKNFRLSLFYNRHIFSTNAQFSHKFSRSQKSYLTQFKSALLPRSTIISTLNLHLLIMYKNSFHLQGWDTQQPTAPLSHRLHLQPLQDIISKSKKIPQNIEKKYQPSLQQRRRDNKTFHSIKIISKNIKTQPERSELYTLSQPNRIAFQKPTPSNTNEEFFKKNPNNATFFKSIITVIQKQPSSLNKSPRFALLHPEQQKSPSFNSKNRKQSRSMKTLVGKIQTARSKQQLQIINKQKQYLHTQFQTEQKRKKKKQLSMKKLKHFFLQTIQGIETQKYQKKQKGQESKWKNMLEKSNRKKKQIEELFKTKLVIGNITKQRKSNKKLYQMLIATPEQRKNFLSKNRVFKNQFDDQDLFCPWDFKNQKIVNYMKAKQHQ